MPVQKATGPGARLPGWLRGGGAILVGIGLLIVLSIVAFVLVNNGDDTTSPGQPTPVTGQPTPVMTLDPQTVNNLTALPQATPLSGMEADVWNTLRDQVAACEDYSPERRRQMEQHIEWLIDPSDMPPDVIVAMGGDTTERLIFGMAGYTSIQWRLNDRPPDSCLVPIGRALNDMLVAVGDPPFDIYD
jgi:hypothetical protein